MPKLLFLTGSLRAESSSRAVTRALIEALGDRATCETADIAALPHYNDDIKNDAAVAALRDAIGAADGVVFVTPEYNYSVPGVLKNAIDWASRPAFDSVFKYKRCFIVTVSGGATGGVRAQSHLKYVLAGMMALPHPGKEILVPFAGKKVENGVFRDDDIMAFAGAQMDEFLASLG
ncbi:NADPH-dependent FMN reductase [Citreimonas salinaria]|uniref:Chromate reductase n=1 Tax=Citreimonas salinaria TaxID=321339 RepID=A0A1H3H5U4_9RHOB|nr:NADPH-dependent FMN reductase [Citreimonas salinaria]SDY10943.1 chromate reductase [Citreimonas salinaria]